MRRYLGPLILLAVAGVAGVILLTTGRNDTPQRVIDPVRLQSPPAADALGKAAEQARLLGGELSDILDRAAAVEHLDLNVPELRRGDITLRDVVVHKDGPRATAEATVDEREIAEYLPRGTTLRYDPKAGGDGIVFRGSAGVLGVSVPVSARVLAQDGAVVVVPEGLPVGRTTLFDDPRVRVGRVSAKPAPGGLRVRVEGEF